MTPFRKLSDGRTEIGEQVRGSDRLVAIVADLFGETITPTALELVEPLKTGARAVLFVEGYTDKAYIERVVAVACKQDLLEGIDIRYNDGANKAALAAILLRQMVGPELPIYILFGLGPAGKISSGDDDQPL